MKGIATKLLSKHKKIWDSFSNNGKKSYTAFEVLGILSNLYDELEADDEYDDIVAIDTKDICNLIELLRGHIASNLIQFERDSTVEDIINEDTIDIHIHNNVTEINNIDLNMDSIITAATEDIDSVLLEWREQVLEK
jgi:hypothetical protein